MSGLRGLANEAVVCAEIKDGVACWTLNLPAQRNPLSFEVKEELNRLAMDFVSDARQKVLVITGAGQFFSAGGDLKFLNSKPSPMSTRRTIASTHSFLRLLHHAEKPVVTAINGGAVGAGVGLAMAGDIILASDQAWFMSGFSRIGAVPDAGVLHQMARAVGMPKARDFLLTNRRIDAIDANAMGMVSRIVPHDKLLHTAHEIAREIAEGPTVSIGLTKAMLNATLSDTFEGNLLREDLAQATALSTEDFSEGVRALGETRKPNYRGQ